MTTQTRTEKDSRRGQDGSPQFRLLRRPDPARRAEFPDQRPALPAPVHPRAGPDQGAPRPRSTSSWACSTRAVARRHRRRRRARWPTGSCDDQFVVDIFQTGSGTSTNMNANEVIAHRAPTSCWAASSRFAQAGPPERPRQHGPVLATTSSRPRSTSRRWPPSTRTCCRRWRGCETALRAEGRGVHADRQDRPHPPAGRHADPARPGVPGLRRPGRARPTAGWHAAARSCARSPLGGTAVGTGINTHPEFAARGPAVLSRADGFEIRETEQPLPGAEHDGRASWRPAARCKTIAVSLLKIANDIRWLGSGPRAGIGEIELPAVQPGCSIMPGKVNPVIAESVAMVAAQVHRQRRRRSTIAGQSGNFELNVMMPVAAYNLLQSIELLAASCDNFADAVHRGAAGHRARARRWSSRG